MSFYLSTFEILRHRELFVGNVFNNKHCFYLSEQFHLMKEDVICFSKTHYLHF